MIELIASAVGIMTDAFLLGLLAVLVVGTAAVIKEYLKPPRP